MSKIKIEKATTRRLKELKVETWSPWECDPSEFDWQYPDEEIAYVKKGKVLVTTEDGEEVEVKAGDIVTFPKGLKCRWKVIERIEKVYTGG